MHFGSLTENSGALSKTGLVHPILFAIWGAVTFAALYSNIIFAYKILLNKYKYQYLCCIASAAGMVLTVSCDFDYSERLQYFLHCAGTLTFSVLTSICVFLLFLFNYRRSRLFAAFTYIIGSILICDLVLLIIFKENALIEAVPIIFVLTLLPVMNFSNLFKEKAYASR